MERSQTLVVDAGPLYASIDRADEGHSAVRDLLASAHGPIVVPTFVIAEVAHLVGTRLTREAELRLVADFAVGNFIAEPVHPSDWLRIADLVQRYADLRLGTAAASVVAAAERLGVTRVATFDRRHFAVVRPRHADAFELLP